MVVLSVVGLMVLLAGGEIVSVWKARPLMAYAMLFALGGACGLASAFVLSRAPSLPLVAPRRGGTGASLRRALADPAFRGALAFLATWGFAANLALPFVALVVLRGMGQPLLVLTFLSCVSGAANVAGYRAFAPLVDRFGSKPVMRVAGALFVVAMAAWALAPREATWTTLATVAAAQGLVGLASAAIDVASTAILMRLAPLDEAPTYLSGASLARSLASGVAPLAGGLALALVPDAALFGAAAVLGLLALARLLRFHEPGEETRPRGLARHVVASAIALAKG
jgi:MFS family permease